MRTYFERYKAGEHQAVWQDLVKLGDKVFDDPVHEDAWSVAQLTMERAKINLETLYERLKHIGYKFELPDEVFTAPDPTAIETLEVLFKPLPLSLKAFYTIIGGVDFVGTHPGLMTFPDDTYSPDISAVLSDPLCIYGLNVDDLVDYRDHYAEEDDEPYPLEISGDIYGKANISGGQAPFIELPDKTADPEVLVTLYDCRFVDYLRINVEWGGFPGFSWLTTPERRKQFEEWFSYTFPPIPQETIDYLKKDLLPF